MGSNLPNEMFVANKKRDRTDSGTNVAEAGEKKKRRIFVIKDLDFFTVGDGYVPCKPEEANAIKKDGIIYKQVGRRFDLTFVSLTCQFLRMREDFKYYWSVTTFDDMGRLYVTIKDNNSKPFTTQALKFACLAWDKVTAECVLPDDLRDFGHDFSVDHIDGNKTNNNVDNGLIMTKAQHDAKTTQSAETIAKNARSVSTPCTMTVYDLEDNVVVKSYEYRYDAMQEFDLTKNDIAHSISYKDMTWNSMVKIKYNGKDCLAQFSIYYLPSLEGEIWKKMSKADHQTLKVSIPKTKEYWVSNKGRFKFVTISTGLSKIRNFQGKKHPRIKLKGTMALFHRIVALVFHRKAMNKYIAKQKRETGKEWTYDTLQVDHIVENDPTNHFADNLQFMTRQKNTEKSNNRPCRFWKRDGTKTKYISVKAATNAIGLSLPTVHKILKNKKYMYKEWRGEYIV